jgi:hypothetical protein
VASGDLVSKKPHQALPEGQKFALTQMDRYSGCELLFLAHRAIGSTNNQGLWNAWYTSVDFHKAGQPSRGLCHSKNMKGWRAKGCVFMKATRTSLRFAPWREEKAGYYLPTVAPHYQLQFLSTLPKVAPGAGTGLGMSPRKRHRNISR